MVLPEVQTIEDGRDLKSVGNTRIESNPRPVLISLTFEVVSVRRDIEVAVSVIHAHLRAIPVK